MAFVRPTSWETKHDWGLLLLLAACVPSRLEMPDGTPNLVAQLLMGYGFPETAVERILGATLPELESALESREAYEAAVRSCARGLRSNNPDAEALELYASELVKASEYVFGGGVTAALVAAQEWGLNDSCVAISARASSPRVHPLALTDDGELAHARAVTEEELVASIAGMGKRGENFFGVLAVVSGPHGEHQVMVEHRSTGWFGEISGPIISLGVVPEEDFDVVFRATIAYAKANLPGSSWG